MILTPHFYFRSVVEVPPELFLQRGICGLVLDIDNTLAPDEQAVPPLVLQWLEQIREAGLSCVIVSNGSEGRAFKIARQCGLPYLAKAAKPSLKTAAEVRRILRCTPDRMAVVGDQLFTDVVYGKRLGAATVLVERMGTDKLLFVRFKRILEKPFMRSIRRMREVRV